MGKRKREARETMRLLKKRMKKLEKRLDYSESETGSESSRSDSSEPDQFSDRQPIQVTTRAEIHTPADPIQIEEVIDDPDPEVLQLLGSNPMKMVTEGPSIHEQIRLRWQSFLSNGIGKEDRIELVEKYPIVGNCQSLSAPKLNREIREILEEGSLKSDSFLSKLQDYLGNGLSALSIPLNNLFSSPSENTNPLLANLVDAGKILTDLHHTISVHRRYLISPKLNPALRKTLDDSGIDSWLFGEDFSEKIKDSQTIKKTCSELALAKPRNQYQQNRGARGMQSHYSQSKNYKRPKQSTRMKKEGKGKSDRTRSQTSAQGSKIQYRRQRYQN